MTSTGLHRRVLLHPAACRCSQEATRELLWPGSTGTSTTQKQNTTNKTKTKREKQQHHKPQERAKRNRPRQRNSEHKEHTTTNNKEGNTDMRTATPRNFMVLPARRRCLTSVRGDSWTRNVSEHQVEQDRPREPTRAKEGRTQGPKDPRTQQDRKRPKEGARAEKRQTANPRTSKRA